MTAVNYLWNPLNDNIVAEYDDAGNTIAEYTTEPEQFGNVVSQRRSGVDSYYHYDGVGSTLAVTDSTGAVTDTRSYTAFGETTEQTGTTVIPYQYVGRNGYYRDEELGQYSVRHRNFRPNKASWDSVDPLLTSQMSSPYVYSHNDPLARIDPSGLIALIARTDSKNNLGCGAFRWETTWVLPGVEESGYVVQYMTIERSCKTCNKGPCGALECSDKSDTFVSKYTEVWYVKYAEKEGTKVGSLSIYPEFCSEIPKSNAQDWWCFNGCAPDRSNNNTCGELKWHGVAFFVSGAYFKAHTDAKKFGFANIPSAGCLYSSDEHVQIPERYIFTNRVTRTLSAHWKCCGGTNCGTTMALSNDAGLKEGDRNFENWKPTTVEDCSTKKGNKCAPFFDSNATCFCKGKLPIPEKIKDG